MFTRKLYSYSLLFSIAIVGTNARAQQSSTGTPGTGPVAKRDVAAINVITQSLTAMGMIASPTLETSAQGTITDRNGNVNPITIETIGTDRVRHNVGSAFTFVSNTGNGFLLINGKKQNLASWATEYERPEHLPALSLMADYLNPNLQIQYIGLETINGTPVHHVRLSVLSIDPSQQAIEDLISEFHVYIDQKTFLVTLTRHFDFSPETLVNRSPVDTVFSDYRSQNGTMLPFHLTRFIAAQQDSDIVFSSISLNATIPDSDFQ